MRRMYLKRAAGGRCRWDRRGGLLPVALLALTVALDGCGGGQISPDLFLVERTSAKSGAKLTMVVSEEGGLRCNGATGLALSDPQIIEARTIAEELQGPLSHHLALAAGPRSVYSYRLRNGEGSISFADDSAGQPKALGKLQLFVLKAEGLCRQP